MLRVLQKLVNQVGCFIFLDNRSSTGGPPKAHSAPAIGTKGLSTATGNDFHLPYISRPRRVRGRNYAHAGIQRGAVNHSVKCRSGGMYVHSRSRDFHVLALAWISICPPALKMMTQPLACLRLTSWAPPLELQLMAATHRNCDFGQLHQCHRIPADCPNVF